MAEKTEFLQAIDDAILDADSLERFINGSDSETVLTRLNAKYPTLQKAIKELFENGGIVGRYKTLVELQTSPLADGAYALVADDVDANNGIYIKEDGAWVKSKYSYDNVIADKLKDTVEFDEDEDILILQDKDGLPVLKIEKDGGLILSELDGTVQSNFKKISEVRDSLSLDETNSILVLKDKNGTPIVSLSNTGELTVSKIRTLNDEVSQRKELRKIQAESRMLADKNRAITDDVERCVTYEIATIEDWGVEQISCRLIIRTAKRKYLIVVSPTVGTGDFGRVESWLQELTVNDDYTITLGEKWQVTKRGTDEHGDYGILLTNITILRTGAKKGRLIATYLKRYAEEKDETFINYSDDGGKTWSPMKSFRGFIPKYDEWRLAMGSPGMGLQIKNGKYAGRVVIACWHASKDYPVRYIAEPFLIYSDDDGETWNLGATDTIIKSSESGIIEVGEDGVLLMFLRDDENKIKQQGFSYDGGVTVTDIRPLEEAYAVKDVATGLLNTRNEFDLSVPKLVMTAPYSKRRERGSIWLSYDEEYWNTKALITEDWIAYSGVESIDENNFIVYWEDSARLSGSVTIVNLKHIFNKEIK